MNFEEAIEERNRLWELYLIAERERIAKILHRMVRVREPHAFNIDWVAENNLTRELFIEKADQILRRG